MSAARNTAATKVATDDDRLMAHVEAGSAVAFAELYERYCARAYRVALSVCHDRGRAEDAVQEAFLSIWRGRASYRRTRGAVAPWLLSVVRYRAIDVARKNGNHAIHRAGEEMIESLPAPGEVSAQVLANAGTAHLHNILERLPNAQREVIALAFFGQLTHTEIATQLALPEGTVKGRMRLGLQKLRTQLSAPE